MILGSYDLVLYCRYSSVSKNSGKFDASHYQKHGEFGGSSQRDAKRQARKAGWVFSRGDVTCPKCAALRARHDERGQRG